MYYSRVARSRDAGCWAVSPIRQRVHAMLVERRAFLAETVVSLSGIRKLVYGVHRGILNHCAPAALLVRVANIAKWQIADFIFTPPPVDVKGLIYGAVVCAPLQSCFADGRVTACRSYITASARASVDVHVRTSAHDDVLSRGEPN